MKNLLKIIMVISMVGFIQVAQADNVGNYMTIVNNIPTMAMKPDEQSQAWVRSAQRMLTLTDETMAQNVMAMNMVATKQGHPIFCFPQGVVLDSNMVNDIIQKTYAELVKTQGALAGNISLSNILMLGLTSRYSCSPAPAADGVGDAAKSPVSSDISLPVMPMLSSAGTAIASESPVTSQPASTVPANMPSSNPFEATVPIQQTVSADTPPPVL